MIRKAMRRLTVLTAGVSVAVVFVSSKPAHAERIISDYEAGKLTLASLTAAPPPYHPVAHRVVAKSRSTGHVVASSQHASRGMVHLVAYHTVRSTAHSAHLRHRT